jgi:hypothetical protein
MFEDIGKMMVGGVGATVYRHTVAIPIGEEIFDVKKFRLVRMPCTTDREKAVKCVLFNKLVDKSNAACMNRLRDSYEKMKMGLKTIPKIERIGDYFTLKKDLSLSNTDKKRRRRRRRRSTRTNNTTGAGKVLDFVHDLPGNKLVTSIATNIFGLPSMQMVNTVAKHIDMVNDAATALTEGIKAHGDELSSVKIQWHSKFNLQRNLSRTVGEEIHQVSLKNEQLAKDDAAHADTVEKKIELMKLVADSLLVDFQPKLFESYLSCANFATHMDTFRDAMLVLNRGFLPPSLIEPAELIELITYVSTEVLNVGMAKLAGSKLLHYNPVFYYTTHGTTAYTRDDNYVYITLEMPIYNQGGLLTVYRIHSFDVDVRTGTSERAHKQPSVGLEDEDYDPLATGSTRVSELDDYLAISDNAEYYLTMKHSYFKSCKSSSDRLVGSLYNCKAMVPMMQHSSVRTCETALFRNSASLVKDKCRFLHTPATHEGHALQIGQSNLFLVHASSRENDVWTLSCPNQDKKDIAPKVFALMTLPCFCSLSTMGYYLPNVMSGCSMDPLGRDDSMRLIKVGFHMPINAFLMHNFVETEKYMADAEQLNGDTLQPEGTLWPSFKNYLKPIEISKLKWTMPLEDVVATVKKYKLDMTKAAKAANAHSKVFVSEIDKALNKSLDFRDVDAEFNKKGPMKAFKDILSIFPGISSVIVALSSGGFLSLIGLVLNGIMFLAVYRLCGAGKAIRKIAKSGKESRRKKRRAAKQSGKAKKTKAESVKLLESGKKSDTDTDTDTDSDFVDGSEESAEDITQA